MWRDSDVDRWPEDQVAQIHSWNRTVSGAQRAETREYGINRALQKSRTLVPPEGSMPMSTFLTHPLEVSDLSSDGSSRPSSHALFYESITFLVHSTTEMLHLHCVQSSSLPFQLTSGSHSQLQFCLNREVNLSHRLGLCTWGTVWSHVLTIAYHLVE